MLEMIILSSIGAMDGVDRTHYNIQAAHEEAISVSCAAKPKISFIARRSQPWNGDRKQDRARAELQSRKKIELGSTVHLSYQVMLTGNRKRSIENLVIGQFHQTPDEGDFEGYPALEISWRQDGVSVYTAGDANASTPRPYPHIKRIGGIKFPFNKWHKINIEAKFSYNGMGYLFVNIDDKRVLSLGNINMGFNDKIGPYWKFGAYFLSNDTRALVRATYRIIDFEEVGGSPFKCEPIVHESEVQ